MGRLATADEIAHGVWLFLVDPDTQYMTGSTLNMDGGLAAAVVVEARGQDGAFLEEVWDVWLAFDS